MAAGKALDGKPYAWRMLGHIAVWAAFAPLAASGDAAGVTVWRDGREALVRWTFSATTDLVVHVQRVANENAYLDPQQEPDATAFYHHRDGNAHVVYMDFHKTLAGKRVHLPKELAGKRISVLQRSPSVTLHTVGTVPPDGGLVLDVADGYGELVLRLDGEL